MVPLRNTGLSVEEIMGYAQFHDHPDNEGV